MADSVSDGNRSKFVSIIIPAYNAERFLARTLESALAQSYEQFDIIVVNDGSTDDTAKIVSEFSAVDQRVRLISTNNHGVAAARNTGISATTAEFIAFLDADDLWSPNKLRLQVEALEGKGDYAAVYTWSLSIDEKERVKQQIASYNLSGYILCRHLITWPVGNGSSLLVRRAVALDIGGFDPKFKQLGCGGAEDLDFELRLVEKYQITCVPEFLVGYRDYPGNMSSDGTRMTRSVIRAVSTALERNQRIPPFCSRWARAVVYGYAVTHSCLSAKLLLYLFLVVTNDTRLGIRSARVLARRLASWAWHRLGTPKRQRSTAVHFYEWNIRQSGRPDKVTQRRVEQLTDVDLMLEAECSKSREIGSRSTQRNKSQSGASNTCQQVRS